MPKTLVLVSQSFPPLDNIAAQRFPSMLPVLEAHGWEVWGVTQRSTGSLPVPLPEARLVRIGRHHQASARVRSGSHFVYGSPLRTAARAVIRAGGIRLRAADGSLLTWRRAVLRELPALRHRLPPPDVVLGTYPPPAALWLARRLARTWRAPWIADFRDLGALRVDARPRWARWLDRRIEAGVLRSVAAITTCGEQWASLLEDAYGCRTQILYNGWDPAQLAANPGADIPPDPALPRDRPYLYFAGRFYERQLEAVARLLAAVAGTPFRVVCRSLGPPEREAWILDAARAQGVAEQVTMLPPVPPQQVPREAQAAAATLVLETVARDFPWTRGHLSGKLLQLIPLRPPVLYVGRPDAEAGDILRRTGKGALCSAVDEIRAELEQLAAGAVRPVDRAAVQAYSKIRQGEHLLELLEAVSAPSARGSLRPVVAAR